MVPTGGGEHAARTKKDPSLVKMAVPFPNAPLLMRLTPSSKDFTRTTESTGPKISSVYTLDEVGTLSMRVGPSQNPFGSPSTSMPRPSTTTVAPSSIAMSM